MKDSCIIYDKPYISKELNQYAVEKKVPVLENDLSLQMASYYDLALISGQEAAEQYNKESRIYTTSENALEWIYQNIRDPKLIQTISLAKDKVKFREMIKPLYPDFFFYSLTIDQLSEFDSKKLKLPVILKPSIGFFSVGVYTIYNVNDWQKAVNNILENHQKWRKDYPETVVGNETFIIEEYIEGEEYAVDAYFDQNGQAVIVNIMKHDFSDASDVSDRLYYTSEKVIKETLSEFTDFLNTINKEMKAVNFPVHIELRKQGDRIIPIECNPMRFAGWCTTDITWFAYGFRTYDYYLNNIAPDWDSLLTGKEDKRYGLIILDKPNDFDYKKEFDYNLLCSKFKKVLSIRKLDHRVFPVFGFLFTETDKQDIGELEEIMKSDLTEFLR